MRKKILILTAFVCWVTSISAQRLSQPMENAVSICVQLSNAAKKFESSTFKEANKRFKAANIADFKNLTLVKGKEGSLDGHLLFDEEFIDSIIVNQKFISFAKRYADKRSARTGGGQKGSNQVKLTTKALGPKQSATWDTYGRGQTEIAIVAEPDGLFTMTIRDAHNQVLYTETNANKQGKGIRKAQLKLPDKKTTISIEVVNHSKKAKSFALLYYIK